MRVTRLVACVLVVSVSIAAAAGSRAANPSNVPHAREDRAASSPLIAESDLRVEVFQRDLKSFHSPMNDVLVTEVSTRFELVSLIDQTELPSEVDWVALQVPYRKADQPPTQLITIGSEIEDLDRSLFAPESGATILGELGFTGELWGTEAERH